jgi:hypothetical protein
MPNTAETKATAADAEIVMKLYDLRREAEMRKARNWYGNADFSTWEAVQKVAMSWGTQENAWLRQFLTYWENAATLVLRGAVHPGLFFDWNGEIIFAYVKIKPWLKQLRQATGSDEFMSKTEELLNSTPELRAKVQWMEDMFKKWTAMRSEAMAKSA